ncbi:MAG: sulfatase-like hydrolase/transferase [Gammaproteobacteria bacterium]|nr:sulfatase-like hydrolase/transferase [Gammaproteobacteria bacterium]
MSDFAIQEWAVSALGRTYEKPFFLAVGFRSPHLPWYMPKEYLNMYPIEKVELPYIDGSDLEDVPLPGKLVAWWSPIRKVARFEDSDHHKIVEANQWHYAVQAYSAASTFVDERIGAVLDTLHNSKHANNTVVILFSDHGWQLGEKQKWRKMALWEDATRVPLVVSYPGQLPKGVISNAPVSLVDIFPTVLDLAELPSPGHDIDGRSLVEAMESSEQPRRGVVTTFMGHHGVRTKRYRYIRYANGDTELYDHVHDPMEHRNLLAVQGERIQHAEVAASLDSYISELHPRRDRKHIEEAPEDIGKLSLDD